MAPVAYDRPNSGPFASEAEALRAVVARLVAALDPEAIYLFGSRARGEHRPDSDFDLLVVTRESDGEAGYDYDRAYAPLRGLGVACDVVPCPKPEFEREKDARTGLCRRVAREGVRLHERR